MFVAITLWYFFGTVCMVNGPADCERIVFDTPRVAAFYKEVAPSSFRSFGECVAALSKWTNTAPVKVMGSEWVEAGCTNKHQPNAAGSSDGR
jgi:hypothetical protein